MSRLRFTCMSAATMVALAALTLNSLAQPPGRNGGGPGGGPGGFFGRGGGPGGPGGFGGSLLMLASNPAVQADIYMKVKDKQKAQIKNLNDKFAQQSRASGRWAAAKTPKARERELTPKARVDGARDKTDRGMETDRGTERQGNGNGQVAQGTGAVGGGFGGYGGGFGGYGGGFAGGFGGYGGGFGGQVQVPNGQGINPNQGQGGGGGRGNRGPGGQQDPELPQRFAMMRQAMDELTQSGRKQPR